MSETLLSAHDLIETERTDFDPSKIERYLHPRPHATLPLEYAFHLLGDVRGKSVLDLGCGSGESVIPLAMRGARVTGLDISPELIGLAHKRTEKAAVKATLLTRSAYETGLFNSSVDVIFCMSVVHHLDIVRISEEMRRILVPGGYVVLKEPVRFSYGYQVLRRLFPAHEDVSDDEHPLTRTELATLMQGFVPHGLRYFRLPFVPIFLRLGKRGVTRMSWRASDWLMRNGGALVEGYATAVVVRLDMPLLQDQRTEVPSIQTKSTHK